MIAILEARRAGLLHPRHWPQNILSGVVVGVVALPLAMAFAIASGLAPEQGLYTAILAGLIVPLFGGSRLQIAGPTGAFVVVLSGIVQTYGVSGLQVATLMAGGLLVLMGAFRMGVIIRFIPAPVIVGFTAGIGVVIWVGQWPSFFGVPTPGGEHFHQKILPLVRSLRQLDVATTTLALVGLLILITWPRVRSVRRVPAPLVAMVVVTAIEWVGHFDSVATVGTAFGGIPQGLPSLEVPTLSFGLVIDLIGPAITTALLGAIESLLSAVVADGMAGTRHDSNQELIGQGIANTVSAMFGGIAATGALARTATNIRNGGTSPISGIVHALTLLVIILLLAPLAAHIPLAVLAAILFVVAWSMSDTRYFIRMVRRAPRTDVAILIVTFLLTVFADLVVAVTVGVLLATLHFLRRMSSSVTVEHELHPGPAGATDSSGTLGHSVDSPISIFTIDGPFFFAAVDAFDRALAGIGDRPRVLVINLQRVPFLDATGIEALERISADMVRAGTLLIYCEANLRVKEKLRRSGLLSHSDLVVYEDSLLDAKRRGSQAGRTTAPALDQERGVNGGKGGEVTDRPSPAPTAPHAESVSWWRRLLDG